MDKDRITGSAKDTAGKVKSAVGDIAGEAKTQASGRAREASGSVQVSYGEALEAVAALQRQIDTALRGAETGTVTTSSNQEAERADPLRVSATDDGSFSTGSYGGYVKGTSVFEVETEPFRALRDESDDDDLQEIKSEVLRLVGANLLDSPEAHLAYIRGRLKSVA